MKTFTALIYQDEDGAFMATVPALPGCNTQAKHLNDLEDRIKEAIVCCLEAQPVKQFNDTFVGICEVEVEV